MDLELWWLLPIPVVFFALGWLAARIDIKHLLRESRALPLSYFKGLNFLLNEQPDKAIESFIEVVKVDPGTVELHFALGSLFRRQGEVERAIRMHQNLLDRHDLPEEKRLLAIFELAQDFHRAGLLDRAEDLFVKLDGTHKSVDWALVDRARQLAGLKGYVTNIPQPTMDGAAVIGAYHDLWKVEKSFRMAKTDLRARPIFHHQRDSIEAHLTVVFAALAVAHHLQQRTSISIRRLVHTLRPAARGCPEFRGTSVAAR